MSVREAAQLRCFYSLFLPWQMGQTHWKVALLGWAGSDCEVVHSFRGCVLDHIFKGAERVPQFLREACHFVGPSLIF